MVQWIDEVDKHAHTLIQPDEEWICRWWIRNYHIHELTRTNKQQSRFENIFCIQVFFSDSFCIFRCWFFSLFLCRFRLLAVLSCGRANRNNRWTHRQLEIKINVNFHTKVWIHWRSCGLPVVSTAHQLSLFASSDSDTNVEEALCGTIELIDLKVKLLEKKRKKKNNSEADGNLNQNSAASESKQQKATRNERMMYVRWLTEKCFLYAVNYLNKISKDRFFVSQPNN